MSRQVIYRSSMPPKKRRSFKKPILLIIVVIAASIFAYKVNNDSAALKQNSRQGTNSQTASSKRSATTPAVTKPAPNPCGANTLAQLALVSISKRELWACQGTTVAYSSAVVTGMENLPADLTPVGTYHVYAKETDMYLNGSDSTGSWHDYVYYWMPFLDNQYGAYGFHDATWRPANAFGNISPYSSNASHGCVELPLATAKWLFAWVSVGTTVTIES